MSTDILTTVNIFLAQVARLWYPCPMGKGTGNMEEPGKNPDLQKTMHLRQTIADRLQLAMKRQGMSQARLAQAAEITSGALSQILQKKRTASTEVLGKMAEALGVSIDFLVGRTEEVEIEAVLQHEQAMALVRAFLDLNERDRERILEMVRLMRETSS